jgi:sulfoxide reductase heme-binding subunit YedZ
VARASFRLTAAKALLFTAALVPAARLVYAILTGGDLTANPIEYITHQTGWYALLFLTLSLAATPTRRFTKWHVVIRFRRMLGLFSFFYGTLHFLTWLVFDKFFSIPDMVADVIKRPYITVGMATYVMLVPLAATSTQGMIRRLGGRRWNLLHRLAYVAAITAVAHFWWLVKSDVREPQRWAAGVTVLLGLRLWWRYQAAPSSRS